jgi:FAD/FMN-containing dehydrogenase
MTLYQTDLAVETLRPGDADYDAAARVFLATGAPALVVRPRDPDQVGAALAYARRRGLAVAVRSGGHSMAGHGTNTGGLVLDLTHLDAVVVLDAQRRLVRVGAGATWGLVAQALDPRGWALTSGDTSGVGVGGLTLGGGIGWLVRKHGLAIDNMVGARVVTVDGRLLATSAHEHPELFWALRGGGGNFGVVVDFDFVAQSIGTVHFGSVVYRLDDAGLLLRRWRDAMRAAPDELSSTLVLMPRMPDAPASAMVLLCYAGSTVSDADAAIEPLLGLGTVNQASIAERRYAEILEDAQVPPGLRLVSRNTLVPALDADTIAVVDGLYAAPGPKMIAVRSLGGAFGRVPPDATAFAHRDAEAMVVGMFMMPGTETHADVDRALVPWQAVADRGTGTYVNFQGSATAADVAAAYPPATYARLAAVKRVYDPENRLALNHNVEPA